MCPRGLVAAVRCQASAAAAPPEPAATARRLVPAAVRLLVSAAASWDAALVEPSPGSAAVRQAESAAWVGSSLAALQAQPAASARAAVWNCRRRRRPRSSRCSSYAQVLPRTAQHTPSIVLTRSKRGAAKCLRRCCDSPGACGIGFRGERIS